MKDDYTPKEDAGNLFKNDKRESDRHPEYRGEAKIRCPHCQQASLVYVSAWVREAKNQTKYFAMKFTHRVLQGQRQG